MGLGDRGGDIEDQFRAPRGAFDYLGCPLADLSFEYLWDHGYPTFKSEGTIVAIGLGKTFPLGMGSISILAGVSRFEKSYEIGFFRGEIINLDSAEIGGVFGGFLRFPFLDQVDSLMGYKLNLRSDFHHSGVSAGGHPYTMEFSGVEHLLYVGFVVSL